MLRVCVMGLTMNVWGQAIFSPILLLAVSKSGFTTRETPRRNVVVENSSILHAPPEKRRDDVKPASCREATRKEHKKGIHGLELTRCLVRHSPRTSKIIFSRKGFLLIGLNTRFVSLTVHIDRPWLLVGLLDGAKHERVTISVARCLNHQY